MRHVGSALGLLGLAVAAGACATTGGTGNSRFDRTPGVRRPSAAQALAQRDSIFAQAIADQEGPGASIRAEFASATGSRRVRGIFHVDQDAYVVVGHIDADGIMRIAFPADPGDDGFVKGDKSYQTQEFFAGFNDQYRWRATSGFFHPTAARYDSYDGGLGYVFIIASWRPMRYDRFQTEGRWDTFELADEDYMRDPRPAIYELASLLVGENREAYTVKFARYYNTTNLYAGGYNSSSAFGLCSTFGMFGFASSPFDSYSLFSSGLWGQSFDYRGQRYFYDRAGGCYNTYSSPFGYTGYRIAGIPGINPPTPRRAFDPERIHRNPLEPREVAPHNMPGRVAVNNGAGEDVPRPSPAYRERGLITYDDPQSEGGIRREPRIGAGNGVGSEPKRPSIQEMVGRHADDEGRNGGWGRAQGANGSSGYQPRRADPGFGSDRGGSGGYTPMPAARVEPSSSGGSAGSSAGASSSPPSAPPASSGGGASGSRPPGPPRSR